MKERSFLARFWSAGCLGLALAPLWVQSQVTQPMVAIHDSELTRSLDSSNSPAIAPTPTGSGTTGLQWWTPDWHYFVLPESLKEGLRSDGTAYTVVGDSNITAGVLLTNGLPRYPIVISLASEAIRNDEIAQFTNYVAAGGFLVVGGSAFTRNTNGTTRGDFAFANEMGIHMVVGSLANWTVNSNVSTTNQLNHRLVAHIPPGVNTWLMPSGSEEIPWGLSPNHPYQVQHDLWKVQANGATVLAQGDNYPFLTVKPYGKGYFIYCSAFQPLIGHTGFAPSMYSYMIFRRAIEWAFENVNLPVPKLSVWPYQYDAAFMVRHDLENFTNEIANIELSAAFEKTNGAKGDYYFCTGTLRDDAAPGGYNTNSIVASLRRAVTNYGATLGPHNGGLKNPSNGALVRGQYDYWHWGLDEALDVTPAGYSSGKSYALTSLTNAFRDIEGWLNGIALPPRNWVACYFNATREDSYDIQVQANVKIAGDQKLTPFPHWTVSTKTPGKRWPLLSEPASDWFVGGLVAQSLEPWHPPGVQNSQTLHSAVDFYYNLGALINFYSHTMSTGLGDAGSLVADYITYCANTNVHPRMWGANAVGVYQWWVQRSNAQITATCTTNGTQTLTSFNIKGATDPNTAVEIYVPATIAYCGIQVVTNGVLAGANTYRTVGHAIRLKVGTSVTNAVIGYYLPGPSGLTFTENFDGVSAPALPPGWTSSATGFQTPWVTQAATSDSAPNSGFTPGPTNIGVNELVSPPILLPEGSSQLSFRHNYDLEAGSGSIAYDGAVLEIKIGNGQYTDILAAGASFDSGGYTDVILTNYGNPLAGRQAWSGNSGGYITTLIDLPAAASGQTNRFRWRCGTDNSTGDNGWHIDSVVVTSITCSCCANPNTPPVLPSLGNLTISETSAVLVTNAATDADLPTQTLSYQLLNAPSGAAIDPNTGVITWTPAENQGPTNITITTWVIDSGFPQLSDTNSFTLTVLESNTPPVLPSQIARTINEQALMTVVNTATDSDVPPNPLTYVLTVTNGLGIQVINASISASGVITWTPTEAQGPSTNTFTTVVTDTNAAAFNTRQLKATNAFSVVVQEVNTAPVLAAMPDRTIAKLTSLFVTNSASDSDLPLNSLSYSLLAAPTNATINSSSGLITWTPNDSQDRTTNSFVTRVVDNGFPALSATNSFKVVVNGDPAINFVSSTLVAEGCVTTNNAIDPGERVTVLFAFTNAGIASTTNLVITLLSTNGIALPSDPQTYGVLAAGAGTLSQAFTFAATGMCGGTITARFQMQDGTLNLGTTAALLTLGGSGVISTQNFDALTVPSLPAGWTTATSGGGTAWRSTNTLADTTTNAAFAANVAVVATSDLLSPALTLPLGQSQLTFRHRFGLEADGNGYYDGGVLEIKIGTNAFVDILAAGGSFVSGAYNGSIASAYSSPIAGRAAWSGFITAYTNTIVNLPLATAGQSVQLRWRLACDNGGPVGEGWRVDSIGFLGAVCCVDSAPILPAQPDMTIDELTSLTVTNTATAPTSAPGDLTYTLLQAPSTAHISATGIITWAPDETDGPGASTFTTVVSDNAYPPLSTTNSFTVTVRDANAAPSLTVPANQTIDELTTLHVSASATDADLPVNLLQFSLLNPPSGMIIVSNTGAISWQPTEAQGPSVNTITVVVTDDGSPPLSATNTFTVTVREVNTAPVLTVPANQTIDELTALNVSASVTDSDLPVNLLKFSLLTPPAGMTINTNTGAITWTPTEAQGPSTNVITVVVTDDGAPILSASNTFTVTIREVNSAPILTVPADQTINELTALSVSASASDPDQPANLLKFSLLTHPSGLVIDTNSGSMAWQPTEAQGPSTNTVTVVVTDDGTPPLSATNSFTITVREVNTAPVLSLPADQTINELSTLSVSASATDVDEPANALRFNLLESPAGMTIITNTGAMTWVPTEAQGPSTNIVTVVVSDDGSPALSSTNSFTVVVLEVNSAPVLPSQPDRSMDQTSSLFVTNTATDNDLPANHLSYTLLSSPTGAQIDSLGFITWTPGTGLVNTGNTFTTVVTDDGVPALSATNSFIVTITRPILPPVLSLAVSSGVVTISWTAVVGRTYKVQYKSNLGDVNWLDLPPTITATGTTTTTTDVIGEVEQRYYRVVMLALP